MATFDLADIVIIDTDGDSFVSDMTSVTLASSTEQGVMNSAAIAAGYTFTCWWTFTAAADGTVTCNFGPSVTADPMEAGGNWYTGTSLAGLTRYGSTLPSEIFHFDVTSGDTVFIQGATTDVHNTLQCVFTGPHTPEFGPVVVLDPWDMTFAEGAQVKFTSLGAGRPRPTMRWQTHDADPV